MDVALRTAMEKAGIEPSTDERGAIIGLNIASRGDRAEEVVRRLGEFPDLIELAGTRTNVGDVALNALRAPRLEILLLDASGITDVGMAAVARCPALRELAIARNRITDVGLKHVAACRNLEFLNCEETSITTSGLAQLAGLAKLEGLLTSGLGAGGAFDLSNHPALNQLRLVMSPITDSHLVHLESATSLQVLELSLTHVTDGIIDRLISMRALLEVHLAGTRVTRDGIKRLRAARPKLAIRY